MNMLEVFNKVEAHLLAQGVRSIRKSKMYMCAYRGAGGLRCSVGCLIKDEFYHEQQIAIKKIKTDTVSANSSRIGIPN